MSGTWLVVPAALGAAGGFSVATVMQYRVAGRAPDARSLGAKEVGSFVKANVSHRIWLMSVGADVAGLGLHVLALRLGTLVVVQTLLVCGVLIALVLDRLLDHRAPSRAEVAWSVVLIAGLGMFLVAVGSPGGTSSAPDSLGVLITGFAAGASVLACLLVAKRRARVAAPALGVAAGVSFALTAALIKTCVDELSRRGLLWLLTHWALWTLAGVGVIGLIINQLAFQAGPLRTSLPAITVVDPLVSVAVGIGVFDESVRSGVAAIGAQVVGLGLLLMSALCLSARSSPEPTRTASGGADASG